MRNIIALIGVTTMVVAAAAGASPLKTHTLGAKSQQVAMCPDCKQKITCAQAGDYLIGFNADLDSPKTGQGKVMVHVLDKNKKPVTDAKVEVGISMPKHGHQVKTLALKHGKGGEYSAPTTLQMPGAWQADVSVTPASGDTVKQSFSFGK